jgi:phosphate starvation-inducible PhoH-like protein
VEAVNVLGGVEGIGRVVFKDVDVVRHDLVRRIVTAYERATHGEQDSDRNPNPRRRPLA